MVFNKLKMDMQEDIVAKLIDFLEAPHATTTILLAEKEKVTYFQLQLLLKFHFYILPF